MRKLVFALLLCIVPVAAELILDYLLYYAEGKPDNHIFTAGFRVAFMISISLLNDTTKKWQSLLLTFGFHLLWFPILYNLLILHQPFDYIGTTAWTDRVEQQIRDIITTPGVLFIKLAVFGSAVKFYINTKIYG